MRKNANTQLRQICLRPAPTNPFLDEISLLAQFIPGSKLCIQFYHINPQLYDISYNLRTNVALSTIILLDFLTYDNALTIVLLTEPFQKAVVNNNKS